MNALICANFKKEKSIFALTELLHALKEAAIGALMPLSARELFLNDYVTYAKEEDLIEKCDIFITVGGDGTILKWGKKQLFLENLF